ncbi:MAG: hypothetical protein IPI17_15910 [Nitrosomonas sp.]|nr:hypothetical protein [Nitrosomonas sp.]
MCLNSCWVEQEAHWFGPDGIHVNYWRREAFTGISCGGEPDSGAKPEHWDDRRKFFLTWQRRPAFALKRCWAVIHRPQPSGQLADGSAIRKFRLVAAPNRDINPGRGT